MDLHVHPDKMQFALGALLLIVVISGCGQERRSGAAFQMVSGIEVVTDAASTGGVSWIDYDSDGDTDLYVTNGYDVSADESTPQPNRLYQNDGLGNLVPVTTGPLAEVAGFSSGSTWGDYDNDGDLDVFVSNQLDQDNFLFRNDGSGVFARIVDGPHVADRGHSYSASWVDVDSDGNLDLFVANGGLSHAGPNFLYRNTGDGSFERAIPSPVTTDTAASGAGVWGDYDADGDPDLFVANRDGANALYRNDGEWSFTSISDSPVLPNVFPSVSAAWGDVDGDLDLDLLVGSLFGAANRVFENDGAGNFTELSDAGDFTLDGGHTYGLNTADFDNDGDLDLAVANWGAASLLYENDGNGMFKRLPRAIFDSGVTRASSLAWGDPDNDGDLDLYIGSWPNEPGPGELNKFFLNEFATDNWLLVRLHGVMSNRSAIGTRVTLTTTVDGQSRTQLREVAAHTSWRSQNQLDVHFGLGEATRADRIEIQWPSGEVQVMSDVTANQTIRVDETGR